MNVDIAYLDNQIRHYAWGMNSAIAELLGRAPGEKPEAELWMGAHPSAPSTVCTDGGRVPLDRAIDEDPDAWLGADVAARFGGRLPFLFKVLAAGTPLSLQAHPTKDQAQAGFARENEQGIPLDAFRRNYKDDNHKPEIICALTEFWAIRGFRPATEIVTFFEAVGPGSLRDRVETLREKPTPASLRELFAGLMTMPEDEQSDLVARIAVRAEARRDKAPAWRWLERLHELYPGDFGVAGAMLLNLVKLEPGEALYIPAGELHAYLQGLGMELMANSDNVLRGGLTSKHVDVPELLKSLTFRMEPPVKVEPLSRGSGEICFETPASEFRLSRIRVEPGRPWSLGDGHAIALLFCTEGEGTLTSRTSRELAVHQGTTVVVPAAAGGAEFQGNATMFCATVP